MATFFSVTGLTWLHT